MTVFNREEDEAYFKDEMIQGLKDILVEKYAIIKKLHSIIEWYEIHYGNIPEDLGGGELKDDDK